MLKVNFSSADDRLGQVKIYKHDDNNSYNPSVFNNVALASLDTSSMQLPCKPMQDIGGMVNARIKHTDPIPNLSGIKAPVISGRLINFGLNYTHEQVMNAGKPILRQPSNFNPNMPSRLPAP